MVNLSPFYNFLFGQQQQQQMQQPQQHRVPLPWLAAQGQAWAAQDPVEMQQSPPAAQPGLVQNLQTFANNLTSPVGKARQSLFDFAGLPKDGQVPQIVKAEDAAPTQMGQMANPAQNQQMLQMYQQMMNAIRQKRGY